ncbi:tyrosine-type recombinase/integrase [Pedobacter sp. JY14-1]|uniref:tyrosine-type recombinase/integrase n=1 Tax=Pedobacter sp. JY14-1 TaxID=3034151 RepID=UPI0023E0A412|nr:tyrosine-type recombinase/integrase [Pedobacter sp. JY14-1]
MAVEQFLTYLQHEKRYSLHTVESYRNDLDQFSGFMTDVFDLEVSKAGHLHIREFVVMLMEKGMQESSVGRKLSTLRSFFKYMLRLGCIASNPVALVKPPKVPKRIPVFVDEHKLDELLDAQCPDDNFPEVRNKVIIELLYGTGIRLAELLALQESDIDFYYGSLKVTGKRSKQRVVPVSKQLLDQLKFYVELKSRHFSANKNAHLIVTDKGIRAYPLMVYKIVKHHLSRVSTQEKLSPHVLRHSYATALLNRGADLNSIKELLGHASLAATQVYTHNSVERLKSIYKQAHPKA